MSGPPNTIEAEFANESNVRSSSSSRLIFYPFAYTLFNEYLGNHCWYCLSESTSLKRCTGCSCAYFCNQECHLLGWKDHKIECKGLRNLSTIPNIEVRLLGRIVVRFKAIKQGKDKADPNFYLNRTSKRKIMDIWAHTEKIRQDSVAMEKFEGIYQKLVEFYGKKHLVSKDEVFELHCRDFINRHAISDKAYLQEIGKGLYLDLCAYDHSCRPNSIYTCDGFIATLRSLDNSVNLNDRTSTFYSYIDLLCSKQQRHKLLKDTWYFDCRCERCMDPNDDILTSMLCPNCTEKPETLQIFGTVSYKDPVTQIIKCPKCNNTVQQGRVLEAITAMRDINRIVENGEIEQMPKGERIGFLKDMLKKYSQILPPINVYFCKIVQLLISLTDASDYKTHLDLHLLTENWIRFCLPPNHPGVALHLQNIGIFYARSGNPHRAQFYLERAQDILNFTLGPDHLMTMDNQAHLNNTIEEVKKARRIMLGELKSNDKVNIGSAAQKVQVVEIKKLTVSYNGDVENENGAVETKEHVVKSMDSAYLNEDDEVDDADLPELLQ
uniref:MYND-type domain-containing protein n=1 Tax=Syphacia muris TaxID=451379 RepID=A0A0N5B0P3_9BILA